MIRIDHFAYEHDFLSNFYSVDIVYEGVGYASTEHAYQASKTLDREKRWIFALESNPNLTAAQAKKIGRSLKLRDDWEKVKVPIMRELLLQKFSRSALGRKLVETGEAYLEEGNWWHDVFWGVCHHRMEGKVCDKPEHEPYGGNHLGYLLMDVRTHLEFTSHHRDAKPLWLHLPVL
jgi:ribA/ribD-fused uncharacterized protein